MPQTSVRLVLTALFVGVMLSGCKPSANGPRGAESPPGLSQAEIEAKITDIVAESMKIDRTTISPNDHFEKDLGFDELDAVELIMQVEQAFDITIPDEDVGPIDTIAQFAAYVKQRKSVP